MTRTLLVLALAACGSKAQPTPAHPVSPALVQTQAQTGTALPTPTTTAKPLSAEECQQLARHMVEVSVKERPDDQRLSVEEQAKLDLKTIVEACQSMRRETYACALAAARTADMASCDQRSPSSSTSNSSVAPPGMSPLPTPRSP